jgi:alpha-beta hydrolase superfamily lysophospholipase
VAVLALAAPAQAFTRQDLRVPMSDGVELAATLYLPDGARPSAGWPAIMAFHGLGQTRVALNGIAESYFAPQGYAVLTVDLRGHGESGGLNELDGPREVQDVRELYDWLSARGDVDPARVGALGVSLGGGLVWRAAAEGVPFAAIVPAATWTDLYGALFPGSLSKSGAVFAVLNDIPSDRFSPLVSSLRNDLLHSTNLDQIRELAAERSVAPLLDQIRAPTLVIQGRRDFAFDLGQARRAWRGLRVPKRLYLGDLGHPPAANPPAELPHLYGLVRDWFDRWLKGIPNGIDTGRRVELAPDPWTGRTVRYAGLPATRGLRLAFPGRRTIAAGGSLVRTARLPRERLETFGAPVLRVSASSPTGWPRLVASLTAIRGGRSVVVADGGVETPIGRGRSVVIRLTDQATPIPRGSTLRLTLGTSTADGLYLNFPLPTGLKITIGRVRLTLPVLRRPISR